MSVLLQILKKLKLMSEWKEVKLGNFINVKGGFSYKGKYIGEGEKFLLGMGCVSYNKTFLDSGARLYSGECSNTHLISPGDLVLATRQQSDNLPILGLPAIIPPKFDGKEVIVGANLYRVINESEIENKYIFWLLRNKDYQNHIYSCSKGSTVRMITKDAVESYIFLCPPKFERQIISKFLWDLENKIDLLHRQNKTLETMAETLFREWFVEGAKEEWEDGVLGDISTNIKDGIKVDDIEPTFKYVALEHIRKKEIGLNNFKYATNVGSNKYRFESEDILFGKLRPYFHKVCFTSFSGICSTDILVIRPNRKDLFCFCLFAFFQNEVVDFSNASTSGTRMPRTSWNILSSYELKIPDKKTIAKFNDLTMPSIEKIEKNIFQIQTLENLRDTLLPKLMNGTIRVI